MSTYVAIYKCRLCGKNIEAHRTGRAIAVKSLHIAISGNVISPMNPHMIEPHWCDNGDIGIADFQGFKKAGE
jgi:hypothetical protein